MMNAIFVCFFWKDILLGKSLGSAIYDVRTARILFYLFSFGANDAEIFDKLFFNNFV